MIQRIQNLLAALAAVATVLLFFFPLTDYYHELYGNYKLYVYGLKCMDPNPKLQVSIWFTSPLWLLAGISFLLSAGTISLYKKRISQLRLVALNILVNIVLVVLIFLFYTSRIETLTQIPPSYQPGVFLPLISLVFLVGANYFIRKDESLVKSSDRLR